MKYMSLHEGISYASTAHMPPVGSTLRIFSAGGIRDCNKRSSRSLIAGSLANGMHDMHERFQLHCHPGTLFVLGSAAYLMCREPLLHNSFLHCTPYSPFLPPLSIDLSSLAHIKWRTKLKTRLTGATVHWDPRLLTVRSLPQGPAASI
jgi:hypothetical protein